MNACIKGPKSERKHNLGFQGFKGGSIVMFSTNSIWRLGTEANGSLELNKRTF